MDERFDKFKKIVLSSDLLDEEKLDIVTLFSRATDEEMDEVLKVLGRDPGILTQLYGNFSAKRKVLQGGNEKDWDNILFEEEELLSKMDEKKD